MVRRQTLIKILKGAAASPQGLYRGKIFKFSHDMTAKEINRIRDSHWEERGLFGLIHEELLPNKANRPSTRWFATSSAREFLRRYSVSLYALPTIPRGIQPYQSLEAKRYANKKQYKARKRKRNQRKYYARLENPKYSAAVYDAYIDASRFPSIGGKGWRDFQMS